MANEKKKTRGIIRIKSKGLRIVFLMLCTITTLAFVVLPDSLFGEKVTTLINGNKSLSVFFRYIAAMITGLFELLLIWILDVISG